MIEKGGKLTNHTPIDNGIKRVFFDKGNDLGYGDFAVFIYIVMYIQYSEDAGKGADNGKRGYAYTTKTRMMAELSIGKDGLNSCIDRLVKYGFIETRDVPNRYGGKPLQEYKLSDKWRSGAG